MRSKLFITSICVFSILTRRQPPITETHQASSVPAFYAMASRFASPPPRTLNYETLPPPVKSKDPPMTPATELYLALSSGKILAHSLDNPELLQTSENFYIPGKSGEAISFNPAVFACKLCPTPDDVQHMWLAYEKHAVEIPIGECLEALCKSPMTPQRQQELYRWIYNKTGMPKKWPHCDLYMSLRHGCPSLLGEFDGDGQDLRLLPLQLEVPCYKSVNFDPVASACACCPDIRIVKHMWEACSRRGLVVDIVECMEALKQSPLSVNQVVDLLKWCCFRVNLPHSLPYSVENPRSSLERQALVELFHVNLPHGLPHLVKNHRYCPHSDLVRKVLAELPAVRIKAFLYDKLQKDDCVECIVSFLLPKSQELKAVNDVRVTVTDSVLSAMYYRNFPYATVPAFHPMTAPWEYAE